MASAAAVGAADLHGARARASTAGCLQNARPADDGCVLEHRHRG